MEVDLAVASAAVAILAVSAAVVLVAAADLPVVVGHLADGDKPTGTLIIRVIYEL